MSTRFKLGFVTYGSRPENEENQRLLESLRKNNFEPIIINLDDITIHYDNPIRVSSPLINDFKELNGVIIRDIFQYLKLGDTLCLYLEHAGIPFIDNGLRHEKYLINKVTDGVKLINAGLPYPRSWHCTSLAEYKKLLQQMEYPLVIKHRSSGKGANVFKVDDLVDAENLLDDIDQQGKTELYILQEFLPLEADYRILVLGGEVLGAMQRIPKEGEFRANYSLGGFTKKIELTDEMKDLALRAAKATGTTFMAGVDLVYTKSGAPYLLEVNRTPGFSGFMKAHGIDVPQRIVDYIKSYFKIG